MECLSFSLTLSRRTKRFSGGTESPPFVVAVWNPLLEVADVVDGVEEGATRAVEGEAEALHASVETCAVQRIAEVLIENDLGADEVVVVVSRAICSG